ncbi:MAG: DJ-1/PfpI family protein [Candidatus Aquicultor sp.]
MSSWRRRVAIVLGDSFNAEIYHRLRDCFSNAGISIIIAALDKNVELIDSKGNELVKPGMGIETLQDFNFDAIILSDGSVSDNLRNSELFQNFIRDEHDAGMILATIDLSVRYLLDAGIVKDHSLTGSPEVRYELETHGARYENEPVWVDGNLISGRLQEDISEFCSVLIDEISLKPAA